nr:sensor histidine kinase [Acidaminobacter sp. JC074]
MDIKSKSTRKRITFVVCLIIITVIINAMFVLTHRMDSSVEIVVQKDFYQSFQLRDNITHYLYNLTEILNYYKSEENIISGGTLFINENSLPFDLRLIYEELEDDLRNDDESIPESLVFEKLAEDYPEEYKAYRQEKINKDLADYREKLSHLEQYGVEYYIESEGVKLTNVPDKNKDYFLNSKVYYTFDADNVLSSFTDYEPLLYGLHALESYPQDTLYLTVNNTTLENQARTWNIEMGIYKPSIILLFGLGLFLLVGFFYMTYEYKTEYFPWVKNSMYFDLKFILFMLFSAIITMFEVEYYRYFGLYLVLPASLVLSFTLLNVYLSVVKHYHDRNFVKSILVLQVFFNICKYIGTIFAKLPTMIRMIPTPFKAKDLDNIIHGVRSISNGDLDHSIQTRTSGLYKTLAEDINTITDGLKNAVQNELKSERMRTELISNVSHDIRTPLTSIITYVDLIKRTDDPEKKDEYLKIIDQKSQRLKNLTDDLFEASKVNSGNIPINLEVIDLQFLLSQCLGELSEKMSDSGLEFVINYYHHHKLALVDGNLMFRIIENVMSNIFKYSLKNSRVYINIEEDDDYLMLIFKNISAFPLNVEPHELFERFKRGDASRTTEGSGLGLSIMEKLIYLQDGRPEIHIDGDLFKVIVKVKKAEA